MCVGDNESKPGVSLVYDTTAAIVSTLRTLRQSQDNGYRTPAVLQLRSASLNLNLVEQAPWLVRQIVGFCLLHYEYVDIARACDLYVSIAATERLLNYVFIDLPTIHDTVGAECTGYKLISTEKQLVSLGYGDLGAAMCEVSERTEEFCNKAVGVSATGKVTETWGTLMGYLVLRAKHRVFEWLPVFYGGDFTSNTTTGRDFAAQEHIYYCTSIPLSW